MVLKPLFLQVNFPCKKPWFQNPIFHRKTELLGFLGFHGFLGVSSSAKDVKEAEEKLRGCYKGRALKNQFVHMVSGLGLQFSYEK